MKLYRWDDSTAEELTDLLTRRYISGGQIDGGVYKALY
jgi:hypothetical protein